MRTKSIKLAKTAHCVYLYASRMAVVVHTDVFKHPIAGRKEFTWVDIYEKLDVACCFSGRIVFHSPNYDPKAELALNAYQVETSEPSTESGSENTKNQKIRVCSLTIYPKRDSKGFYWIRTPDLISDGMTYQPEVDEAFNPEWFEGGQWGLHTIGKIYRHQEAKAESVAA